MAKLLDCPASLVWELCGLPSIGGLVEEEGPAVVSFKTLVITAAVSSSVVFAMPAASHAVPIIAPPVKTDAAGDGNLVQVHFRRYCRYGRCYVRYNPYGEYREYLRPQYATCPPNYGYYRPDYGADLPCKSHFRPPYLDYPYRWRHYPVNPFADLFD